MRPEERNDSDSFEVYADWKTMALMAALFLVVLCAPGCGTSHAGSSDVENDRDLADGRFEVNGERILKSTLTVNDGVLIVGRNWAQDRLVTGALSPVLRSIPLEEADRITIRNVTIEASPDAAVVLDLSRFTSATLENVRIVGGIVGIRFGEGSSAHLSNVQILDVEVGIELLEGAGAVNMIGGAISASVAAVDDSAEPGAVELFGTVFP